MTAQATDLLSLPLDKIAVILVDFQNDFCTAAGQGQPTNTHNEATARRANHFAADATTLGAHVIYTQQILDYAKMAPRQQRWEQPDGLCAIGSGGPTCTSTPSPAPSS